MARESESKWERRLRWLRVANDGFPIVVQYIGVVMMIYAAFIDRGKNPELIPAATGMISFRVLYSYGGRKGHGDEN